MAQGDNMFITPQDYFKAVQDSFSALPKNPEQFKETLEKTKKVVDIETKNVKEVISICNKSLHGEASINELMKVNKLVQSAFVAGRFAVAMSFPGSIFVLPLLSKIADEYDFDFIPESVKQEFNI